MATKNRADLKAYFVKNAIPTEADYADLIDSQLNQAQDGVFRPAGEPLSIVASEAEGQSALRLYAEYPAEDPEWLMSLHPAEDATTAPSDRRRGLGIVDSDGKTRLFVDRETGRVGVGTIAPSALLHVAGEAHVGGLNVGEGSNVGYVRAIERAETAGRALTIGIEGNAPDDAIVLWQAGAARLTVSHGKVMVHQEDWRAPVLKNKWVNFGKGYNNAGFFKDSLGIVHLRGLVKGGAVNYQKPMFTLPAGYRPPSRELLGVSHTGGGGDAVLGRIDIFPNGDVAMYEGNNGWVSLDGVTFRSASS